MANVLFFWNRILKAGVEDGELSREGREAIKVALLCWISIRRTASSISWNTESGEYVSEPFWGNQGRNNYLSTPDLHWSSFHSIDFRLLTSTYEMTSQNMSFFWASTEKP